MRIFVADDVMSEAACRAVQGAMHGGVPEPAEILEMGAGIALAANVRRASQVEVSEAMLDVIGACLDGQRHAIGAFFECSLGSREGVNLLRYRAGDFYLPHVDRGYLEGWPAAAERHLTLVLFLNSSREVDPHGGFSGGVLRLLEDDGAPVEIEARRGTLVAFPSSIVHEVTPVLEGTRDTVVDWFRMGS